MIHKSGGAIISFFRGSQDKYIKKSILIQKIIYHIYIANSSQQQQPNLLPKYQPKRAGDLGWGKLFRFKCEIKNYFQLAKTNLRTQFNCNIDMIENQTQAYISNWISKR